MQQIALEGNSRKNRKLSLNDTDRIGLEKEFERCEFIKISHKKRRKAFGEAASNSCLLPIPNSPILPDRRACYFVAAQSSIVLSTMQRNVSKRLQRSSRLSGWLETSSSGLTKEVNCEHLAAASLVLSGQNVPVPVFDGMPHGEIPISVVSFDEETTLNGKPVGYSRRVRNKRDTDPFPNGNVPLLSGKCTFRQQFCKRPYLRGREDPVSAATQRSDMADRYLPDAEITPLLCKLVKTGA
ncbi:hypothetical protein HZH66_007620 [Vespula vulgaris]|uniref:Uncharacterized protein n=1 Tax=Vespula vulgaris TaxID=7454 RepID=A0A834JY26_VESVU|nr:hypothetical protein HZH66_007620 [Vespula vulgaris]